MALLEPSGYTEEWTDDDQGLWPQARCEQLLSRGMHTEYELASWKPAGVFSNDPNAPDLTNTPALPFPFDGRDLAAFMLAGHGCMVADFYGEWASGPDAHQLSQIDPGNNFAKRAVKEAFDAYREAVWKVGKRDLELDRRARESCTAYSNARSEALLQHRVSEVPQPQPGDSDTRRMELGAEYRRRLALVEGDVSALEAEMNRLQAEDKAAEQKWLHAMVAELLKPATDAAEPEVPPAPHPVPVANPETAMVVAQAMPVVAVDIEAVPQVAPANGPLPVVRYIRTGWKDGPAFDYVAQQFAQHGPFQAKALIASLKKNTDPESPFEVRGGVLTVRVTGQALQDKTIENAMVTIRSRAKELKALQG